MLSSIAAFRRVLHSRSLRRLLVAFFFFTLAEWGTWVALLVWAHEAGGAGFVGVVAAVQLVFAAFVAPLLSAMGDRMSRGRALALSYLAVGMSLAVTGGVLVADAHEIVVVALAAIATTLISVARPIHSSLIPDAASEPADAVAANIVCATLEGAGSFLGPAFAGVMLIVGGPAAVFVVLGAGVVVGAYVAAGLTQVARSGMLTASSPDGILAAFRTLARIPAQRFVVLLGGTSQLVGGAVDVLSVVLAIEILDLGEGGPGFAMSLMGLGGFAGAILAVSVVGHRLGPVLVAGALLRGAALILLGVEPAWIFLFVATGAGFGLIELGVRTLLQRLAPPDVMSRVFGVLESVSLLGLAGGSLLASGLIAAFGVQAAFMYFGGLVPLVVILGHRLLAAADRHAQLPEEVLRALGTNALVSVMATPARELLARRSRIVEFEPGVVLLAEGELSNHVLFVVEGTVEVTKGAVSLAHIGPGQIVGEIAALHRVPRTATVTAMESVTAISVPGDAFVSAVEGETDAWSMSSSLTGRRLAQQQA